MSYENAVTRYVSVNLHGGHTVRVKEAQSSIDGQWQPISAENDKGEVGLVELASQTQSYHYSTPTYGHLWFVSKK
jgi:hypothetical protein